ncbi:protein FAM214A isoform X1 [Dendroctonus ponderosae]|nr:protein FAM214A isoform X1 [Dendroctonus ponderosae]XP_019771975.2 protein FAM214A isoform X1 [Dendroctonus ponderosae]XP_019771976.2 protein FAM214A isoform X1 [Dendroctonus ponderosae]XP_048518267.1 protein FAM214A isoform X1 [Dendroctonus ponderosae]
MHSFNLDPESNSCLDEGDLLVAVATLVTEGRIPGPDAANPKAKDFHEGPHCNLLTGTNRNHQCDDANLLCERFQRNRDIILNVFKQGGPFCIEVLFTCTCKPLGKLDADHLANTVLLEQWHFSAGPNRGSSAITFNINQLLSAIRSQLYFSQITAWLVTQNKSAPLTADNFRYRLSSPEGLLAPLTFSLTASRHEFPSTDLGNGTALSITFSSAPRLSAKPHLDCWHNAMELKKELVDDRMHTSCTVKGKHCCEEIEDPDKHRTYGGKRSKAADNAKNYLDLGKQIEEAKQDLERHTRPHERRHNLNDLKTVQDKGQLLLDAIERSGKRNHTNKVRCAETQTWPLSECDKYNCDMSESDTFSCRQKNNLNMHVDNSHCDSPVLIKQASGARKKITFERNESLVDQSQSTNEPNIPAAHDQAKCRRNLGNSTPAAFHVRTGLPLCSSPAPARKGQTRFDFDSSLTSVSAINSALFSSSLSTDEESESEGGIASPCSPEIYTGLKKVLTPVYRQKGRPTSLLGTFEESVLNGRLEPVSTVHGFTAELGASGSFVPKHIFVPVTAFFYALGDQDRLSTPYLGHISLGKKGYNVPKVGTVQVTLFNPLGTVVKMFVLPYDLADMPPNSQTFIRQRTLYMPSGLGSCEADFTPKWLRFVIHIRFMSSKSGKIYLHSDIRMIIMKKADMDTATALDMEKNYEMRSFSHMPTSPRYSPRK